MISFGSSGGAGRVAHEVIIYKNISTLSGLADSKRIFSQLRDIFGRADVNKDVKVWRNEEIIIEKKPVHFK